MQNRILLSCLLAAAISTLAIANVCATQTAAKAQAQPAAHTVVEIGKLTGTGYRIDIPANWNRQLIVFFHGYALDPVTFPASEKISPMFDPMLAQGYAVLQSAYSQTGWAVEQAAADTEQLRKFFVSKHGKPAKTFVMGMSMGGTLTVMTIEQRADIYAGALSMCGAIEPTDRIMQRDFALRAAFDYYFPNLLGSLVPVPADYRSDDAVVSRISAALASNPKAVRALLGFYGAAEAANLAPIIADVTDDTKELQQRLHGNPFSNDDLIYTGTGDDYALNDGVHRYRGETRAQVALARWYTPNGNLTRPMLELHDTGDPLVPASSTFEYALIAQRAGHGDNFVQQYVNKEGHCVFTPAEIGRAFDELATWVSEGKRPKSGKLP